MTEKKELLTAAMAFHAAQVEWEDAFGPSAKAAASKALDDAKDRLIGAALTFGEATAEAPGRVIDLMARLQDSLKGQRKSAAQCPACRSWYRHEPLDGCVNVWHTVPLTAGRDADD